MEPEKWETLSSKYLVNDKWLKLRSDRCKLPNGNIIEPYYITEYPDWANVVAITPKQEVVMVRQYRHGRGSLELELPGGIIEKGQTPTDAAPRELREETGYTSNNWQKLGSTCANPDNHTNQSHSFLALDAMPEHVQDLDDNEIIAVELIPWEKVVEMALTGKIEQAMHITTIFWAIHKLEQ